MPFCPNCGKEIGEFLVSCPECGQKLKEGFTPEERQKYIDELKTSVEREQPAKKTKMKKKLLIGLGAVVGIFIIIGIIAVATGPVEEPAQIQPTPPVEEIPPSPIEPVAFEPVTIRGSGDKTSPPFILTTQEWIIDWSYKTDEPEYAVFGFFIYPRGETALYIESMLFAEATSGSTYSYAGPGDYYIKVIAANIKSWKVVIKPA